MSSSVVYNNDEEIVVPADVSGGKSASLFSLVGKTTTEIVNKTTAPLEKCDFKVMLEITGAGSGSKDRPGVDLVAVLDVSGSMGWKDKLTNETNLSKMKIAMQFVTKKLSPIDRLSIVTFSSRSKEPLCQLRQMTEKSQAEVEDIVNTKLVAGGGTNIPAGLQNGLKVLNDRRHKTGRVVAIMLMSDGISDGDVATLAIGDVPVYTFGFGADADSEMLNTIAYKSKGGTFSAVQNQKDLNIAFSQCLAGLLSVAVQDLKLTVKQQESKIHKVLAGNYPQSFAEDEEEEEEGSVTVTFGDLYDKEIRKVIVNLALPAVSNRMGTDVLEISYTYSDGKEANPLIATVTRIETTVEPEREEVTIEDSRIRVVRMIHQAILLAEKENMKDAQDKLVEAGKLLEGVVDEPNLFIEMLQYELQQLLKLMKTYDIYKKQGRAYALSSVTSHDRQRYAARGDLEKLRLFSTPRMDTYLEQAMSYDKHPDKPPPTQDADEKKEVAADPLALIAGPLSYYIQMTIQSLISIDDILNNKDDKEEVVANPLARMASAISCHIQTAIQSLASIDDILKNNVDDKEQVVANPLAHIASALSNYVHTAIQSLKSFDEILINNVSR